MRSVKNLFVVPVGLPGMGKSTFSKHLKRTTSTHFSKKSSTLNLIEPNTDLNMPVIEFKKISYDRILGDMVDEYQKMHKETSFHHALDIIRPLADQEYLDRIAALCKSDNSLDRENDPRAALQNKTKSAKGA
jgi:hypothetical protein